MPNGIHICIFVYGASYTNLLAEILLANLATLVLEIPEELRRLAMSPDAFTTGMFFPADGETRTPPGGAYKRSGGASWTRPRRRAGPPTLRRPRPGGMLPKPPRGEKPDSRDRHRVAGGNRDGVLRSAVWRRNTGHHC